MSRHHFFDNRETEVPNVRLYGYTYENMCVQKELHSISCKATVAVAMSASREWISNRQILSIAPGYNDTPEHQIKYALVPLVSSVANACSHEFYWLPTYLANNDEVREWDNVNYKQS